MALDVGRLGTVTSSCHSGVSERAAELRAVAAHWHGESSESGARCESNAPLAPAPCAYLAQPYSVTLVSPGFHRPFVGLSVSHKGDRAATPRGRAEPGAAVRCLPHLKATSDNLKLKGEAHTSSGVPH